MAHERTVGGLRCGEVLALLSEFVDRQLDADVRQRVLDHLAGCDWCERFGGEFADVIAAIRRELKEPAPLSAEVAARLREALDKSR